MGADLLLKDLIAIGINHDSAVIALSDMSLYFGAKFGVDSAIEVIVQITNVVRAAFCHIPPRRLG